MENIIKDIIAEYWLNTNRYCGTSSKYILVMIQEKGKKTSEKEIIHIIKKLERRELVTTRKIIQDNGSINVWVYPKKKLLERYNDSKIDELVYKLYGITEKEQKIIEGK